MGKGDKIKKMNIVLALFVVILAGACIYLVYSRQQYKSEQKANAIRQVILSEKADRDKKARDRAFYEKYKLSSTADYLTYKKELQFLAEGKYDALLLTNTACTFKAEWYENYFAQKVLIPTELPDTPERLEKYLEAALTLGDYVKDIYLILDPYALEMSYYNEHKYGDTMQTYLQMLQQALWNYADEYKEIKFHVHIPVKSLKTWENYSLEELARNHDAWEQFIKLSSRYSNMVMNCAATEEWLIANDSLFDSEGYLLEDMERYIMACEESGSRYKINYNDFDRLWNNLYAAIMNDTEKQYYRPDLSDREVVFFGDNIFDHFEESYHNVPGMFEVLTNAKVYDFSIRGTAAANTETLTNSFADIIDRLVNKDYSETGVAKKACGEIQRFAEGSHDAAKLTFVILYGFGDYSNNVAIGSKADETPDTYMGALNYGIDKLKKLYPKAHFLLISPIYTDYNNGGKTGFEKGSNSLLQYVDAMKKTSIKHDTCYINAYDKSGINASTTYLYLSDMVNLTDQGSYIITKMIISHFIADAAK